MNGTIGNSYPEKATKSEARSCTANKSTIEPPPIAMGALPENPGGANPTIEERATLT
jgi:hypothetical protein